VTVGTRPVQFLDYLPEAFRFEDGRTPNDVGPFLKAFENLFEELQSEIEGRADRPEGGIPDLFAPATTPPAQYAHLVAPPARRPDALEFLEYLAAWVGLGVRADVTRRFEESDDAYATRRATWNRRYLATAISLAPVRGTLPGIEGALRAWLREDLLESAPPARPVMIITDLGRAHPDVDAVFQVGETALLGVNTVLGEGPPHFFLVDLITDPAVPELRHPRGLDGVARGARLVLEADKPAHTYYQLRVRAHTMQLAPPSQTHIGGMPGAQVGRTTLLWEEPWVYETLC
jgi:hypothetical protein